MTRGINMSKKAGEFVFDAENKKRFKEYKNIKFMAELAKLSQWEKENGKRFDKIEASDLVETIIQSGITYNTLKQYKVILDKYAYWLLDKTEYFTKLVKDHNIRDSLFKKEVDKQLFPTGSNFFAMLEQQKLNTMEKIALSLLYEQFTDQDILELKIGNCSDISRNEIKLGDNTYTIDERVSQYIKKSIEEKESNTCLCDEGYVYRRAKNVDSPRSNISFSSIITSVNNNDSEINVDEKSIKLSRFYQWLYNVERTRKKNLSEKDIFVEIDKHKIVGSKKKYTPQQNTTNKREIYDKYIIFKRIYSETIDKTEIFTITTSIGAQPKELPFDNIVLTLEPPNEADTDNIIGKKNIERGTIGENYIREELSLEYTEDGGFKICKVNDTCGYDLQVSKNSKPLLNIEVKVVNNFSNVIHMSLNELEMADKYKEKYSIYVVSLPQNNSIPEAKYVIIKNPIETLGINYKEVINKFKISFDNCTIGCSSVTINDWYHSCNQELS